MAKDKEKNINNQEHKKKKKNKKKANWISRIFAITMLVLMVSSIVASVFAYM